ncbi:MAG TPA: transcriptional regulator [Lacisediminihabitans sp.]|uniref:transcriptional regulator n=1 Tax=Lacisediminihabitans sp. TaxID=2787631 RepID=UPI002ED881A6
MTDRGAEPLFDPIIHAPQRLQICALLSRGGEVDFATLRDVLEVSDATLSKHLKTLGDAGYVTLRRVHRDSGHARAWARLTPEGQRALDGHFSFLTRLREGT